MPETAFNLAFQTGDLHLRGKRRDIPCTIRKDSGSSGKETEIIEASTLTALPLFHAKGVNVRGKTRKMYRHKLSSQLAITTKVCAGAFFGRFFFVSHGIPMKKNLSNCTIAKMEFKRGKISPFSVGRPRIALKSSCGLKHFFSLICCTTPPQNAPRVGYPSDAPALRPCPLQVCVQAIPLHKKKKL